jgi:RsiW-degrading membrane proteinase PrsW (M82 family)
MDGHWRWDGSAWQPTLPTPLPTLTHHTLVPRRRRYLWLLLIGLPLLVSLSFITAGGSNTFFLIPLVLLGAFFVPVVYVIYLNDLDLFGGLSFWLLFRIALLTAFFALPVAYLLEHFTGAGVHALFPALATGLIEEGVKLLVLLFFMRRAKHRFELDGIIFGAACGMAFAAFESLGYALVALLNGGTTTLLFTLWLRALLAPLGHGTWTAAIAAVIWRQRFSTSGRLGLSVVWAYLVSSLLHGLWDWAPFSGLGIFVWWIVIGAISLFVLRHRLREARRQQSSSLVSL